MRPNYVEIEGQLIQFGYPSYEGTFYDIAMLEGNLGYAPNYNPYLLVQVDYLIAANGQMLQRQAYALNNLIGDLGGVYDVLFTLLAIFVMPWSRHNFIVSQLE